MHDEQDQAAVALSDRRWLRLGPEHTRFWRYGEKPARHQPLDERQLLTDAAFAQIMAGLTCSATRSQKAASVTSRRCAR